MDSQNGFILRTEGLGKVYPDGGVNAVVDVTFGIGYGQYVAIMGPSGSGKSTLLNLLGALDNPTCGEVFFEEKPLSKMGSLDRFRSQKVGFVFQSFYLLPTLTARENIQIPMFEGPLSASARAKRADSLLESVGLSHRATHLPSRLSVGERQRVAIARALANEPSILLADEPTGNLDSRSGEDVLNLFAGLHRDRGMTLIVITHSQDVANRSQRIIRIHDGRIVADEPVVEAPAS
jgi:putative ABC transport system ATP-binding protein